MRTTKSQISMGSIIDKTPAFTFKSHLHRPALPYNKIHIIFPLLTVIEKISTLTFILVH